MLAPPPPPAAPEWLARFLPRFVRAECAQTPQPDGEYGEWSLEGALLFVDVVGFTARVEALVAAGPQGIELANELLNQTIGVLVEELTAGGGDVVVFAGDALFVLWRVGDAAEDLAAATVRAAACALAALERRRRPTGIDDPPSLRFSLGAGPFRAHRVGGHAERRHCLLSGPAFDQVGRADALARNDALLASPEAVRGTHGALKGQMLSLGVMQVRSTWSEEASSTHRPSGFIDGPAAASYLPDALAEGVMTLDAGQLSEFRHPSVIFARLPGLLREGQLDGPLAHQACLRVQRIVSALQGTALQFVIDDKGPVFIIAFGLAARTHEDDPARAALAALRIVAELGALGIACGLGVATGRAYCGLIGSATRSSYTLIGQTMNLAARLMQHAAPGPLFDERSQELARVRIAFAAEGMARVKGLQAPVPIYRAIAARVHSQALEAERDATQELIGRAREIDILQGQLDAVLSNRTGKLVVIVGEAGIGKSRLLRELLGRAAQTAAFALTLNAGAIDAIPYQRLRAGLRLLLERLGEADAQAAAALADDPWLRSFLNPESVAQPNLEDAERAFRTRAVIAQVILQTARHRPLLLCIEDTHWMDSLSWSVTARVAQGLEVAGTALMLVLTTRQLEGHAPPDVLARLGKSGLMRVPLGPLGADDGVRLVCDTIGAAALSPAAEAWIATHSGGIPLFCRELAIAAVASGELRITDGRADLDPDIARRLRSSQLPDTLQGLIGSRIDRLEQGEQRTLRMAAVIGLRFTLDALAALHEGEPRALQQDLRGLHAQGLLERESSEGGYAFQHALIRDAVYESLPYRRRRELHGRLAQWLEQRFAADLISHSALLAFHWERAESWNLAYSARLRAGEGALQNYTHREAIEHFSAASAMRDAHPVLRNHPRAASPELGLARALHRTGDERASRRHVEHALRAAGEQPPGTRSEQLLALLRELLWRLLPLTPRRPTALQSAGTLRTAVEAYDLLPDLLYYDNDVLGLGHATLRFLRLAEAEGRATPEHARALGWYALLRSGLGSRRLIDGTLDSALDVARASADPATEAWLRLARGSVLAQFGAWTEAERWLREAAQRYALMGDRMRGWNVASGLGHVLIYRGELAAGAAVLGAAIADNRDTDNPVFLCWGLSGYAGALHRLGAPAERAGIVRRLREARAALAQRPDAAADLFSRGLLAAALWRDGQTEEARELARDSIENALDRAPVVWLQVSAYLGLLEVLRESARDPARLAESLRLMRRTERSLRAFARLIPVARPTLSLLRGEIERLSGRPQRVRKRLLQGLKQARALRLPLEQGELHLALASTLPFDHAHRERQQALAIYARIGARDERLADESLSLAARSASEP